MNLTRLGLAVFVVLGSLVLGFCRPTPALGQGVSKEREEIDLKGLLAKYVEWGLPLPPPDAPLVQQPAGGARINGQIRRLYQLGFELPAPAGDTGRVLVGTEDQPAGNVWTPIDPAGVVAEDVRAEAGRATGFLHNAALATAVQCEARGWHELARALVGQRETFAESVNANAGRRQAVTAVPPGLSPRAALAHVAFAHWAAALVEPGCDRVAVARRLDALLDAEPTLAQDRKKRALLRSLQGALRPGTGAAGSVEALIDALVDAGGRANSLASSDRAAGRLFDDPRYLAVARQGFVAVPALLDHLTDDRLTRAVRPSLGNGIPLHLCVGDVASLVVKSLAGNDLPPGWLSDRTRLLDLREQPARAWWANASRQSEEDYLADHVFPPPPAGKIRQAHPLMVALLAERYPARLPALYDAVMAAGDDPARMGQNPSGIPWASQDEIAAAVGGSGLPRERKVALFQAALGHPETAKAAQTQLDRLDAAGTPERLIRWLDKLPAAFDGGWGEFHRESLVEFVLRTDDPAVWDALARAAARADPAVRLELVAEVIGPPAAGRRRALAFLARFLDDPAACDPAASRERMVTESPVMMWGRVEVRNLAAANAARILRPGEIKDRRRWTPDEWAGERAAVKEELAKELHD